MTRLERFAACAYAHYLQYGLQLRERETAGFESVDMGNLYHEALERYSRKLEASEYDWFGVPDEARSLMAAEAMDEALEGYPNASLSDSAQNMHQTKRMKDIFDQTVRTRCVISFRPELIRRTVCSTVSICRMM